LRSVELVFRDDNDRGSRTVLQGAEES